ncbi:MAG: 30S ribosomal protein S2 [Phycisphaerae bacterium]
MASELVRDLLDSGIHFGHRVSRWNPKMKPYIFGKRNMIHIIDIKETLKGILRSKKYLAKLVAMGGDVLFVGTKRQARGAVQAQAQRGNMHYVNERWLGGTLTNFRTIRSRLARLEELEKLEATGELANYSKKMISTLTREMRKMKRNLEGIRKMERMPKVMVIIDPGFEHIAVKEAKKLNIPTICLIDTEGDPDWADIPIPGNDDSMRGIEIVLKELTDAIAEGMAARPEEQVITEQPTIQEGYSPDQEQRQRRPRRRPPQQQQQRYSPQPAPAPRPAPVVTEPVVEKPVEQPIIEQPQVALPPEQSSTPASA